MTLLHLLLATTASAGLSLDVSSPQQSVLVGEPVKLVVRWKAEQDLQRVILERGLFDEGSLSFVVDDGRQPKTYREIPHTTLCREIFHGGMKKGAVTVTNLILVQGRYEGEGPRGWGGFLFRAPGTYSVKVVYTDPHSDLSATSSALRFTVTEPSDEDREILEAAKARPMMLGRLGDRESQAKVKDLIERHPRSPYLRYTRLRVLEARLSNPDRDLAPDKLERLRRYDREGLDRYRAEQQQEIADAVSAETGWGPFEEEALALAIEAAWQTGGKEKADRAGAELVRKYPDSATVWEMQERAAKSRRPSPAPPR